ncbi:hypothetical protein HanOQP8_Chr13g0474901 [Helianthus annuus]|nr:hypothetical protein HanOQP8_Chr13g0474901 [Helianthus annuus]
MLPLSLSLSLSQISLSLSMNCLQQRTILIRHTSPSPSRSTTPSHRLHPDPPHHTTTSI